MQLTKTLVIVAVAFTASASAMAIAPEGRSATLATRAVEIQAMISKADGEAKLAKRFGVPTIPDSGTPAPALAAIQAAIAEFQTELAAIEELKDNFQGNVEDAAALFGDIVETFTTLVAALAGAPLPEVPEVPEIPARHTALAARQGGLVGAIEALGENLQLILTQVQSFIGTVLEELGLGTVKNLVDGIFEPVLSLVDTITNVLNAVAPGLSGIVDPILELISDIAAALGIDLNLPSPVQVIEAPAVKKVEVSA